MKSLLTFPTRNLIGGVVFVLAVGSRGIVGYVSQGWKSRQRTLHGRADGVVILGRANHAEALLEFQAGDG